MSTIFWCCLWCVIANAASAEPRRPVTTSTGPHPIESWARERGITGPWSIVSAGEMGLGLRASQPIRAGDTIIRVPLPALLTLADGGHALGDGPKDDAAFAVLVAEYLRTGDDPFGPWLRADFASGGGLATLPGTWTEAELELLGTINPWQGNYAQRQRRQRIARYANLSATRPRARTRSPRCYHSCPASRARVPGCPGPNGTAAPSGPPAHFHHRHL